MPGCASPQLGRKINYGPVRFGSLGEMKLIQKTWGENSFSWRHGRSVSLDWSLNLTGKNITCCWGFSGDGVWWSQSWCWEIKWEYGAWRE